MAGLYELVKEFEILPSQWCLKNAPEQLHRMLLATNSTLGNGTFSVVLPIDQTRVLKVSTCVASSLILPRLIRSPSPGLPLVFQDFGVVGKVKAVAGFYDDIPLRAYVMERLYPLWSLKDVRRDRCPRGEANASTLGRRRNRGV